MLRVEIFEESREELLAQGQKLAEEKKFTAALAKYDKLLRLVPNNVEALKARANLHFKMGNKDLGKKDFDKILSLQPKKLTKYDQALEIIRAKDLKQLETAEKLLNELARAQDPSSNNPGVKKLLNQYCFAQAQVYWLQSRMQEATEAFEHAMTMDQLDTDASTAEQKQLAQHRQAALEFFKLRVEPIDSETKAITQKIHADLTNQHLYLKRSDAFLEAKAYDQALCDLAIARWTNRIFGLKTMVLVSVFYKKAQEIFIEKGDFSRACQMQADILKVDAQVFNRDPHDRNLVPLAQRKTEFAKLLLRKGEALCNEKKYQEATSFLECGIALEPGKKFAYRQLAMAFFKLGKMEDAERIQKDAQSKWKHDDEISYWFKEKPETLKEKKPAIPPAVTFKKVQAKTIEEVKLTPEERKKRHEERIAAMKALRETRNKESQEKAQKINWTQFFSAQQRERQQNNEKKRKAKIEANAERRAATKKASGWTRRSAVAASSSKLEEQKQIVAELELIKEKERQERLKTENDRREETQRKIAKEYEARKKFIKKQAKAATQRQIDKKRFANVSYQFSDRDQYPVVMEVPVSPLEFVIMDCLERSGENIIAELKGSALVSKIKAKLRNELQTKAVKELDITVNARPEQIEKALSQFGIKPLKKPGYFNIKTFDEEGQPITVQIGSSPHPTYYQDAYERDYKRNSPSQNKYGEVRDPCEGIEDIKSDVLQTIKDPDVSLYEDPSRILRGLKVMERDNLKASPELLAEMHRCAEYLPICTEVYRVHTWMINAFSRPHVSMEEVVNNFQFLVRERKDDSNPIEKNWKLLDKLFDIASAAKINLEEKWIYAAFRECLPVICEDIYMVFYVAIAVNTTNYTHEMRKEIFADNPLLEDKLKRYTMFPYEYARLEQHRLNYYLMQAEYEVPHSRVAAR